MLEGLLGLVGSPSLLVELVQQLGQAGVHEVPLVATQHHWKLGDVALVVVGSGWFGGGHIRPLLALDDRRRTGSPGYRASGGGTLWPVSFARPWAPSAPRSAAAGASGDSA